MYFECGCLNNIYFVLIILIIVISSMNINIMKMQPVYHLSYLLKSFLVLCLILKLYYMLHTFNGILLKFYNIYDYFMPYLYFMKFLCVLTIF